MTHESQIASLQGEVWDKGSLTTSLSPSSKVDLSMIDRTKLAALSELGRTEHWKGLTFLKFNESQESNVGYQRMEKNTNAITSGTYS